MADDDQSGGALRKQLEDTLNENRLLKADLKAHKVNELLRKPEFGLVKPEDLVDVDLDQIEAKASALQASATEVVRTLLAKQGLEGETLDKKVAEFLEGKAPVAEASVDTGAAQVAALGQISGQPVGAVVPSDLEGVSAMEYVFSQGK